MGHGVQLLVSVRDPAEAIAALAGGADLIDVKEPSRGPLGRADAETIAAVEQTVGGRVPVSAALGELRDRLTASDELPAGIRYVKWGLCGLRPEPWRRHLAVARRSAMGHCTVAVAYADWAPANSPPAGDLCAFAASERMSPVLLDTFTKDGPNLLDWLPLEEIAFLVKSCHDAGVRVALAGSLDAAAIDRLRGVRPDWFAVRSAACDGGRGGIVSERRVRELAELVHGL
ncbi:MAG TPA: (5-formylfuran-3-yl)methyl phosphate synthase [Gemmataceae bacterium]|jgi:hypothetical protein|nr:(5-formylfuran-3-yl)methyl phosphate synthase [Gemmataceae bacterium]